MNLSKKLFFVILLLNNKFILCNNDNKKYVIGVHNNEHNTPFGFFSIFEGTLNRLIWAKKNNITPVIYWGSSCLYYQPQGYNGSYNVWEYYFYPVSDLKYESGDSIDREYLAPDKSRIPHIDRKYDDNFHKNVKFFVNKIINQYIKIKPNILSKVENFYKENLKGKINIGIHLRGTDKGTETKVIDPIKMLQKANEIASQNQNSQFFIATDEEKLLELAKKTLKNPVVYCQTHRSSDGSPIHYPKKQNAAILGEEVLIDTLILSKCDFFIHTLSNISTFTMFFNPEIRNVFFGEFD